MISASREEARIFILSVKLQNFQKEFTRRKNYMLKMKKRMLSLFMSAMMLVTTFSGMTVIAGAEETGAKPALEICTQEGAEGSAKPATSYTADKLKSLAGEKNADGYVYQYYKDNTWKAVVATSVVKLDTLLSDAGVSFKAGDSIKFETGDGFSVSLTQKQIEENGYFFNPAKNGEKSAVPAGLAVEWNEGEITDGYAALAAKASDIGKLRSVIGTTEALYKGTKDSLTGKAASADEKLNYSPGYRLATGVTKVTVIHGADVSGFVKPPKKDGDAKKDDASKPDKKDNIANPDKKDDAGKKDDTGKTDNKSDASKPNNNGTVAVDVKNFSDIAAGAWFENSVKVMLEKGIMKGVSDTAFEPSSNVTRAQFVTMLYRIAGMPEAGANTFADVNAGSWYEKAVAWASTNKIVNGYSEKQFAPSDSLTREQLATMLYKYAGSPEAKALDNSAFKDADAVSDYAKTALGWAVEKGIITGAGNNTAAPKQNATRAQVAAMIDRYLQLK